MEKGCENSAVYRASPMDGSCQPRETEARAPDFNSSFTAEFINRSKLLGILSGYFSRLFLPGK